MALSLQSTFHLHGVGPSYTMKLAISGVETIGELAALDNLEELSDESTIPVSILRKIQLRAKSLVNNEIIQIRPFQMPSRKLLFLDIETTLRDRMVWLIGFMTEDGFTQLYADNREQERAILTEFLRALRKYRRDSIATWTRFDTRVLRSRITLHGLTLDPLSSMVNFDLHHQLLMSYIFPTYGYGLKKVGSYLEYPFKNPWLNGLKVAMDYEKHLLNGKPMSPQTFQYNEDDVRALPYILDWAVDRIDRDIRARDKHKKILKNRTHKNLNRSIDKK